jgi:hypothetical protein
MPIVTLNDLEAEPAYQALRQKVANQIKDKSIPFIYSEKHEFKFPKGKVAPVFVCETSSIDSKVKDVVNKSKKGAVAEGFCYVHDKKLVLRVVKGSLAESAFKGSVKGSWGSIMIAKGAGGGAIDDDKNVGGNPVNINKSKLEQFPDILKRQQAKLNQANTRLKELEEEKKKATTLKSETQKQKPVPTGNKQVDEDAMKQWQLLVDQAQETYLKVVQEVQEQNKIKRFADDLIKKASAAKTDQEKADVVFAFDKFGSTLKELEGTAYKAMKDTNDAIMVLGRTQDTWALQMKDVEKARALVVEASKYNLTANDAFIKGGLDIKARFQMVTDFNSETIAFMKQSGVNKAKFMEYVNRVKDKEPALWNKNSGEPAVSAREVGQLLDDGYWFGLYPDPKTGKNIQMMFPRALKPSVLEEIRKRRKD